MALTISLGLRETKLILGTARYVFNRIEKTFLICAGSIALLACTGSLLVSKVVLRTFPNSGDEFVYLFQAQTLLQGRIWNQPPPILHIFSANHIIETADIWVGKWPPGWPGIIALFLGIGIKAWMVSPALNGLTALLIAYLGREIRDKATGILAAALYAATAFSVFNGASFFSHVFTAACAVGFAIFGIQFLKSPTLGRAIGVGAMLGLVGLTRTYSAVLFAIPFSTNVILRWNSRLIVQALVGLALGGIPFLIGLLLYNHAITGNALLAPQMVYDGVKWWGLSDASIRVTDNIFELLDWTSAPILTIYFICFFYLAVCRHLTFVDFLFPLLLVGMAFYNADAGNRYGPRYVFEAYPFLALTCGSGLSLVIERLQERRSALAASAVSLCILGLIGGLLRIPDISATFSRIINERTDLNDKVEELKLDNAIVLVQSDVGVILPMERGDLLRNWPGLTQPVLYVDGRKANIQELKERFPSRTIWSYTREAHSPTGKLRQISEVPAD